MREEKKTQSISHRMDRLKATHLLVGALGFVAFLVTGQFMHTQFNHLQGMADGPRLMHRSAHIYLLFSSLLNFLVGCYFQASRPGLYKNIQIVGSIFLIAGPPLLCASFLHESFLQNLHRPYARAAIYLALAGAVLHFISSGKALKVNE